MHVCVPSCIKSTSQSYEIQKQNPTFSGIYIDSSSECLPVMAIRRCFIYTCILSVRLFSGCQALGQTGLGPNRETITKEIISSVLLRLRTVSSYISTAVLPLNLLASFNFLYALFFGPVVSSTLFGYFTVMGGKKTPPRLSFHVCLVCD